MEHIKFTSLQITVAIVLSIIILTVAQILSFSISELPLNIGVTPAICNIFAGVLYCVFAFLGTKLLCQKLLKTSLLELKIPRFKVKAVCNISFDNACFGFANCNTARRTLGDQYF